MIAYLLAVLGVVTVVTGVALLSIPAALITAGLCLTAAALLIDFDRKGSA